MALEPDCNDVTVAGLEAERPRHLNVSVSVWKCHREELLSWKKVSTAKTRRQHDRRDANYSFPVLCGLRFVADHDVVIHGVGDVVDSEHQASAIFDSGKTRS